MLCSTAALGLAVFGHPGLAFAEPACDAAARVTAVRDAAAVTRLMTGLPFAGALRISRVSYLNYNDLRPQLKAVALAAFQHGDVRVTAGDIAPRSFGAAFVSASYFDLLGVRLYAGRAFASADDVPGSATRSVVISDRLWDALFDRRASVVGESIDVNGQTMTVIGIAEAAFHGVHARHQADIWLPGVLEHAVRNEPRLRADDRASGGYYEFVARLAAGATWADASKELQTVTTWLAETHPAENQKFWEVGFHEYGPIGCPNP
jgi:hypothetical protein